jgi:hypothetical protein
VTRDTEVEGRLRTEVAEVEGRLRLEIEAVPKEIAEVEGGFRKELADVEGRLRLEIERSRSSILRWFVSFLVGQTAVLLAARLALTRTA